MPAATLPAPTAAAPTISRERALGWAALGLSGVVAMAAAHRLGAGHALLPAHASPWLVLHLASVVPALPLGGWLLVAAKGGARHRRLGRLWALLMVVAALSSFGLTGLTGRLSPLHLLAVAVLAGVPRAVWQASRRDIAGHRRTIGRLAGGLVAAAAFAFVPGRLLGAWLMG